MIKIENNGYFYFFTIFISTFNLSAAFSGAVGGIPNHFIVSPPDDLRNVTRDSYITTHVHVYHVYHAIMLTSAWQDSTAAGPHCAVCPASRSIV